MNNSENTKIEESNEVIKLLQNKILKLQEEIQDLTCNIIENENAMFEARANITVLKHRVLIYENALKKLCYA